MAVLYSVGRTLVGAEELELKSAAGALESLTTAKAAGGVVEFSTGTVRTADLARSDALPFKEIGLGKPLGIEILTMYTGDAPGRSIFDRVIGKGKPDLLVVSAVKNLLVANAAPRAINQLIEDIEDNQLYRPGALHEGSPLVYYSPAMTDDVFFVSIELVADSFSGELFDHVGSLFTAAAGLPVFAPAAKFLVAGPTISQMARKLAKAFLETSPFLRADEDIRFDTAGLPPELARFAVFINDRDVDEFRGFSPSPISSAGRDIVVLINTVTGEEYRGNKPYVIAAFDGRNRPELEKFTPQHAGAAVLEQFYGDPKGPASVVAGVLQDAMSLYNDLTFRKKAELAKRELGALPEGSPERKTAEDRLNAFIRNISHDTLKEGLSA